MDFIGILIIAAVIAVFVIIVFIWAKKTGKRQAERMKLLSEDQKEYIKAAGLKERDKNLVSCLAVLTNIAEGDGAKAAIDFIFWNAWTERYEIGDDKLKRDFIAQNGLKVGDYITLVIKTKDGIIDSVKEIEAVK